MCKKCTNSIFVIFILLVKIKNLFKVIFCCQHVKVSQRKKDICHFHLCVKYEQNRWLRHCIIKSLFHETKQFNFPEKNVPSQTCLTWVSDHFQHPHFAPSLFCSVTHPQGSRPCRAAPTSLKYDFKDACEILDNLFIDTTTLK